MDAKFERLKQVAQRGDIGAFYTLIREDVKLLEYIDELPFADTPLHIAASTGQIPFAMETMGLKPSFARKLDPNGFSPIHLALQNEHIDLVHQLLQLDGDLVRVKGRERLTPLHYVVESGKHLNLLDKFLLHCPNSITDVTVQNETVLHIAFKKTRLEVFQFFVGWLANSSSENAEFNKRTVLNWKNNEGNTVLHILVSRDQTQVVRHFLSWGNRFLGKRFVDVNSKNFEDKTAWDMLQEGNREIRFMLRLAGAKPGSSLSTFNGYANPEYQRLSRVPMVDAVLNYIFAMSWVDAVLNNNFAMSRVDAVLNNILMVSRADAFSFSYNNFGHGMSSELRKLTVEWRSMLLVVAALLVTLCFQAVLTPPGGVWQDNGQCITTEPGSSYHGLSPLNIFKKIPPSNKSVGSSNYPKIIYLSQSNTTLACEHKAGTAIALEYPFFALFVVCNTMLFSLSNSLIVVLISKLKMKALFIPFNIILCLSYFYSAWIITDAPSLMIPLVSVASFYFLSMPLLTWEM